MIRLDPANRHYDPQRYRPERVRIQGPACGAAQEVLSDGRPSLGRGRIDHAAHL
jgi:hypothetical protein